MNDFKMLAMTWEEQEQILYRKDILKQVLFFPYL